MFKVSLLSFFIVNINVSIVIFGAIKMLKVMEMKSILLPTLELIKIDISGLKVKRFSKLGNRVLLFKLESLSKFTMEFPLKRGILLLVVLRLSWCVVISFSKRGFLLIEGCFGWMCINNKFNILL